MGFHSSESDAISTRYLYSTKVVLGCGSFGRIVEGKDALTGTSLAIKFETNDKHANTLKHEETVLSAFNGSVGFPKLYDYIPFKDCNVLIMEKLGQNLSANVLKRKKFASKLLA